jgi:hypothetical protein
MTIETEHKLECAREARQQAALLALGKLRDALMEKGSTNPKFRLRSLSRLVSLIDPNCPICLSLGWVCENHTDLAWDEEKGCQCGAGMPCECQRADDIEQPDVDKVLSKDPPIKYKPAMR